MRTFARSCRGSAALLLVLAASCGRHEAADEKSDDPGAVVEVRAVALETRTFRERIAAPGQWRAVDALGVTAPFAALVESLAVDVGDAVARGDLLAVLVTRESRSAVIGAEQLVAAANDPASRAEAERALRQARRDVVRVPLLATMGGTVVRRAAARGAEVAEGGELLTIVAPQSLVFEAHVPPSQVGRIAVGQPARIEMEDGTALEAAVVRRLPQTSAEDQSALFRLAPAQPAPAGLIERYGTAKIAIGAPRRALAVPDSALVEDDLTGEVRIACVGAGDVAGWTPVKLGLGEDGWHELLAPALAPGTRAIVSGQRGLPDSTRVSFAP